jgi:plastocyanin
MNSRSLAILMLALTACEGEPPKSEYAAAAAVPPEPATLATTEVAAPPSATPLPGAIPACACNCGCPGGATVATGAAVADAGAPHAEPTAPVAAAAALPLTISGSVTTTPKWAASSAVVYLEGAPVEPSTKMTATITNHQMNFLPYVSVVPVGGRVVFRNDDPFPHNVFSPDGERFNVGMIAPHEGRAREFKIAGEYSLLCNLHPGMLGYVVITPSSYYAKADGRGHFSIKNVPPGTYKVSAWAPRQQVVTKSVTVKDGDVAVDFELQR